MTLEVRSAHQAERDVIVFKALANPVRLRIVSLVAAAAEGQVSAGQIVEAFDLSQPTISHHLRLLREAGVLTTYKTSTYVFYRFAPTLIETVSAVLPAKAAAAPPAETVIDRQPRAVVSDPPADGPAKGKASKDRSAKDRSAKDKAAKDKKKPKAAKKDKKKAKKPKKK